ncbi:MAG TPA: hypothetical protein VNF49_14065 [Candidatus Binataceae bacterium]|nr:hypothetical protein [Candidatus Binataceae bacterium]
MRRLVVPALLVLLLAIQAASLLPAYRRSRLSVVSVVYRARSPFYAAALDPPEMRRLLDAAAESQRAAMSDLEPIFSVDGALVTARFALRSGNVRDVAAAFGRMASGEAARLIFERVAVEVTSGCAQAIMACNAPAARALPRPELAVVGIDRSRLPWLRPVDILAALVYVATLLVWLKAETRRRATPPAG